MKFKGRCSNCGKAGNLHCGSCTGCPGAHLAGCLRTTAAGSWGGVSR
jgi:hypothetical protein